MRPQILYPLTFVLGLISCNFVANKMANDEEATTTSFKKATDPAVYIYDIDLHKAKDTALAAKGKAAYTSFRKMSTYLDSLHDVMDVQSQKDEKAARKLLLDTSAARRLNNHLSDFIGICKTIQLSDTSKEVMTQLLASADLSEAHLSQLSTTQMIHGLNGQKLYCQQICALLLEDIDNKLK